MEHSFAGWRRSSYSGQEGHCVEISAWRKSSHSIGNGGECVEVGAWRTSSYSGEEGNCVEVAPGQVSVLARDSKDPDGPVLGFGADAWGAFLDTVKSGRLDLT